MINATALLAAGLSLLSPGAQQTIAGAVNQAAPGAGTATGEPIPGSIAHQAEQTQRAILVAVGLVALVVLFLSLRRK